MVFEDDLFVPLRSAWGGIVAAKAGGKRALVDIILLRIVGMDLAGAVAAFAGQRLVLVFGQGEQAVGVMIESYPIALPELRALPNLPQLPEKLRKHVSAGYVQGETVWLEFDHGSFFDEICRDIYR